MSTPEPPEHLQAAGRRLWECVLSDYEVAGAELEVLRLACEALDQAEEAREALSVGMLIPGRFGLRMNPACTAHNAAALRFSRLLRQLGLQDVVDAHRPARVA